MPAPGILGSEYGSTRCKASAWKKLIRSYLSTVFLFPDLTKFRNVKETGKDLEAMQDGQNWLPRIH